MHRARRQKEMLRPYLYNIVVDLWGIDLLQQWNTYFNVPAVQSKKSHVSEKDIIRYRSLAIQTAMNKNNLAKLQSTNSLAFKIVN